MTDQVRVLVVDDSPVMRRILATALAGDPRIKVVGTAADGEEGLARIEQLRPDLVTMDVEMPRMDGLTALSAARSRWPRLPVIMISTLTQSGAIATLEALGRGASDFVAKPNAGVGDGIRRFGEQLCPKVLALVQRPQPPAPTIRPPVLPLPRGGRVKLVAIGASTGGPDALTRLLHGLTHPLPVPVVIVQHMPPVFTTMLAERLASHCHTNVVEARDGMHCTPGTIALAPGDHHLRVTNEAGGYVLRLDRGGAPVNSCRPSVDVLFRSVAEVVGGHALGIVLTGLGRDGCEGARALTAAGTDVLVQDEASSVVWGMPGAIARAGLARGVMPIPELAATIQTRVGAVGAALARRA